MTSLSPASIAASTDDTAMLTTCCDDREINMFKSIMMSQRTTERDLAFMSQRAATFTTAGGSLTPSRDDEDEVRSSTRDSYVDPTTPEMFLATLNRRETNTSVTQLPVPGTRVDASLRQSASPSDQVLTSAVNHVGVTSSAVIFSQTETISSNNSHTVTTDTGLDNKVWRLPLALRSAADNVSMSAAVGSNMADRRTTSGLQREELATVGAAVAAVAVFWSLLAFTLCVVVRLRKRKQRRRMRDRLHADADAQTAMMEAMVRAELARGRSHASDSRLPPTYVNVAELIPPSSSTCDLDMTDFFHLAFDNKSNFHGVWKKQRYNDIISGRSRDYTNARWQDGSRAMESRDQLGLATAHRANNRRRIISHEDDYCLLNGARDVHATTGNGQLLCNGQLTKVKSLDSVCKAPDELVFEEKCRQKARRRRRCRIKRSASTSRCLVSAADKQTPSASTPAANGTDTRCDGADDDVICHLPVTDVTESTECAKRTSPPEKEDHPAAICEANSHRPVDSSIMCTSEVAQRCEKMAAPEVCSLGEREPTSSSPQGVFAAARTCSVAQQYDRRTTQLGAPPAHLRRIVPPYCAMTAAPAPSADQCYDRLPRLVRCMPPPPPPPLPGHVMRLFVTPSNTAKSLYPAANASLVGTAGRPARFPRMGQTGLATNSHRTTLHAARPDRIPL